MDPMTIMMIMSALASRGKGGSGGGEQGGFMSGGGGDFFGQLLGGLGQGLLAGGGGPSGPEKNLLNAKSTLARTQAAGINSRSLQELLELFVKSGGRGGL